MLCLLLWSHTFSSAQRQYPILLSVCYTICCVMSNLTCHKTVPDCSPPKHITPASSWCPQLCSPILLALQPNRDLSNPPHLTLSSNIRTSPSPYLALLTAAATAQWKFSHTLGQFRNKLQLVSAGIIWKPRMRLRTVATCSWPVVCLATSARGRQTSSLSVTPAHT